ncbi:hypothetical protein FNV43_RR25603 [Rhamnella rubrinervis]|uniref:Uncharacterized protein n=1 Tax=Rhamnella rubrinervis TaxID=2594499 RepID=A0A8K0GNJ0_9ROSA|nr:hypothetical protein FNV43_RR25603 [Rhamnella rubrinervis]
MGVICALDRNSSSNSSQNSSNDGNKGGVPNSNYVVPLDKSFSLSSSSCITRPLAEILRDLNKRIPENIIGTPSHAAATDTPITTTFIPWYHANRMLSFYAPGWCGEIRDVIFSDNGSVTVVYRVTIRGSDGELESVLCFTFHMTLTNVTLCFGVFSFELNGSHLLRMKPYS